MSSAMEAISFRIVPADGPSAGPLRDGAPAREEVARLRTALDLSSDAVLFLHRWSLTVLDVNSAACSMLGYSPCELQSMSWPEFASGITRGETAAAVARVIQGQTPLTTVTIEYLHRRGFAIPMEVRLQRLEAGGASVLIAVACDLRERLRFEKLSQHEAFHDPLTGLPNRPLLECRLQQVIDAAARGGRPFAVIFVDLDRFKEVNDTLGHLAGDRLLRIAAQRLSAGVRPGDLVTRFGGDEFVVLLDRVRDAEDAEAVAERIRRSICGPISWNDRAVHLSASVGLAVGSEACRSVESIIEDADRAMYREKFADRSAAERLGIAEESREDRTGLCVAFPQRPR